MPDITIRTLDNSETIVSGEAFDGFVASFRGEVLTADSPDYDEKCIGWAREFFDASAPYASGTVYVNFMTEDEEDRVKAAYGPNYDRLVELKNKYDPTNLFRVNHNIKPTV